MTWLQGGPYYELSFLIQNSVDKAQLINNLMILVNGIELVQIITSEDEIERKKDEFINGYVYDGIIYRVLDLNTKVDVAGMRKSRLHVQELSKELVQLNFWFYGSEFDAEEWNQKGLKEGDKPEFRLLFNSLKKKIKPILGTIAYEEDCSGLFNTNNSSPHSDYSLAKLKLNEIKERVESYSFEHCWINSKQIGNEKQIEFTTA